MVSSSLTGMEHLWQIKLTLVWRSMVTSLKVLKGQMMMRWRDTSWKGNKW